MFASTQRDFTEAVPDTTGAYVLRPGRRLRHDRLPVLTLTHQTAPYRAGNRRPNIPAGLGLAPSDPFISLGVG